jgi:glucose uptake protein GlcU
LISAVLLCVFVVAMILLNAVHPIDNAKIILRLLALLAGFLWAAGQMLKEVRGEKHPS